MPRAHRSQAGVAAVEFAATVVVFLLFIMAIMELARVVFVINTLAEVTRRAAQHAATTDYSNNAAMTLVRQRAIFRSSPGSLVLADPITDDYLRIDYLALVMNGDGSTTMTPIGTLPATPADNKSICMLDPHDPTCIQFVRVRVCQPGATTVCDAVPYKSLTSLIQLPFNLPKSTTIVKAGKLGL